MTANELEPLANMLDEMIEAAQSELGSAKENYDYAVAAASASRLYDLFLVRLKVMDMGDAE